MPEKIEMWSKYGPRVVLGNPMKPDEIIENVVAVTNQSKGSVLAVLSELDVQIIAGLKVGRIVRLTNGTRFEPVGKKDGSINIIVTVSPEVDKIVNSSFRGKWANAENIDKSEVEMMEVWNAKHPEKPFSLD